VRLFVARAQERRDGFDLTTANARAVSEICARLDGVPLAIELAAARVGSMGVEAIAARLDDRFRLLSTGSSDLPTRQRTLRATLDWSWDLLDAHERTLLSRLSVFAGGWTLEAAEAVCAGAGMESWAVVDGLDGLVSRSLVQVDETGEGAIRYRLLETVRQYAWERFEAAGEEAATRAMHLMYFLGLAEQADPELRRTKQASWLDRLEQEHDNLRAALSWARERAMAEEGQRLAASLSRFWETRGYLGEGRRWLEEMLAGGQGARATRARALHGAGNLTMRQGEYRAALALYQEALALRRDLGDTPGIASSLVSVANVLYETAEYSQAEALYAEGLALYITLGDRWGSATALNNQGMAARGQSQYERATALLQEALARRRDLGDQRAVAESLNNLGLVASAQGDYERAADLFAEGLLLSRDIGARHILAEALEGLAWVAAARGQSRHAARLGAAAQAERDALGQPVPSTDRVDHDRAVQATRAALGEAAFAAAWAEGLAMSLDEAIALALGAGPAG
jgi:non-specific serine/threonine protein kinase